MEGNKHLSEVREGVNLWRATNGTTFPTLHCIARALPIVEM